MVLLVIAGAAIWFRGAARRRSGLVAPPCKPHRDPHRLRGGDRASQLLPSAASTSPSGVPEVIPIVLADRRPLDAAPAADPLRPLRLRDRRQPRGGPPRRRQPALGAHRSVRALLGDRRASAGSCSARSSTGSTAPTRPTPASSILYSVAAAVIGGTSLFGGRGKPIHGLLGGLADRRHRVRRLAAAAGSAVNAARRTSSPERCCSSRSSSTCLRGGAPRTGSVARV